MRAPIQHNDAILKMRREGGGGGESFSGHFLSPEEQSEGSRLGKEEK